MRGVVAVLFVGALVSGCSEEHVVGQSCGVDGDCEGLDEGYCPEALVCTRECATHSDCGCVEATTNADLGRGRCDAACVDFGDGVQVCVRACDGEASCEGLTECRQVGLGYGICL